MARALRVGEVALVALLVPVTALTAVGLLYLVRPHVLMPGPSVPMALPLDELPGHDGMALLPFLAVWALAGLGLGLLARALRIERLTAGLLFAVATGAILFVETGVSIFVVRQIPAGNAFRAAGHVQAVYIAAAIVGAGGALLGAHGRGGSRRAPAVLALFVACAGLLDVASAITPEIASRLALIEGATPDVVPRLAHALVVPVGLALIVLSRGLWRRRRRAWQLTLALMVAAATLHLLKGLDYEEAAVSLGIALALIARRHDFEGPGDPSVRTRLLVRAPLFAAAIFAYGAVALWINRISVDRPYTLGFALRETGLALVGIETSSSEHLASGLGDWFPLSVLALGAAAALALLAAWLGPWRYRLTRHARERERAHTLVRSFGVDTLAPFALRADKSYFFSEDEQAFLAYRVVAGVAVVSGDPVGPRASVAALVPRFLDFAHERGWRVTILGAGERYLDLYAKDGLHALYHGDEAVVSTERFSLEGREIRKVRQSVSRLQRQRYSVEVRYAGDVHDDLRAELEEVAREWRGGAATKGFTMELDTLFRLDDGDAVFAIGRDGEGAVRGFLHFVVVHAGRMLSLSSMPRRLSTPNGFNEWLVVESIRWAREHDFERLSLNFAPFAALLAPGVEADLSSGERVQRRALRTLRGHGFQLDSLLAFNRKFFPTWERRFVVYERRLDLPRVGAAGLAAEGYLPLVGTRQ